MNKRINEPGTIKDVRAKKLIAGNRIAAERHAMKICIFCGDRVTWWFGREDNFPTDSPGRVHDCPKYPEERKAKIKEIKNEPDKPSPFIVRKQGAQEREAVQASPRTNKARILRRPYNSGILRDPV